ncbi:helix-turn-helix domain-containing protein [Chryseobacterium sp. Tr-659]|uniref:helix-turn-helix domain-containing protein n=1 Tax=Chryseobacterium sp. Tr-659 TaxID=2608340 RepID=UPI001423899B|nr:helix-turn-helix domain-containing protein [Chryseobacterium sp. Tr-659]NIF07149.1 helix-turn-helix domain-containing protein [Chryseobacterium sp. Tr-659]
MRPNYKKIYHDMLRLEHPEKLQDPKIRELLERLHTSEDVLRLNEKLFKSSRENQKLRTYDRKTMLKLLKYQKKHGHSTSYMSRKYKISRTTLSKWKVMFEEELEETTKDAG